MKKRIMLPALTLLLIFLFMAGCKEEAALKPECVMQIDDVGLREGVFLRRYKMTGDYGSHKEFTPEILKAFIKKIQERDYLFIQDAFDRGMNNESTVREKLEEYNIGLLASNHPCFFENMVIPNEELQEFYKKKTVKYDVDVALANSYSMADSIYKFLKAGNKMEKPKRDDDRISFPKFMQFKDVTYGVELHPEVYPQLINMKPGQISRPIFTMPNWAVVVLKKKSKNRALKSFEQEKDQLVVQNHAMFKYYRNKQLLKDLKKKYDTAVSTQYYQPMVSAYGAFKEYYRIDPEKIENSDLPNIFIKIHDKEISLERFISLFNAAFSTFRLPEITENDLGSFADNYINQYVLYLDALEKGADDDVLVKDKIINKEHRTLFSKYLKEEMAQKVSFSDADARQYHNNNRDKYEAEYKSLEQRVKFDLRDKLLHEKIDKTADRLRKKYGVRYNEPLLRKISAQLTKERKEQGSNISK